MIRPLQSFEYITWTAPVIILYLLFYADNQVPIVGQEGFCRHCMPIKACDRDLLVIARPD